jgi:hypothetical protein
VALEIQAIAQAQVAEFVVGELAGQEAARLITKL